MQKVSPSSPGTPPPSSPLPPTPGELDLILSSLVADTEHHFDACARACRGVDDVDALEARLAESGLAGTDAMKAVLGEVLGRRREQIQKKLTKKMKTERRLLEKRAVVGVGDDREVLEGVVDAAELDDKRRRKRELGVDVDNWMDWTVGVWRSLVLTSLCMSKMLGITALLATVGFANVMMTEKIVGGGPRELNITETGDTGLADGTSLEQGNGDVALALMVMSFGGALGTYWTVQLFLGIRQMRSYLVLPFVPVATLAGVAFYYEYGGDHIDGRLLGVLVTITAALLGGAMGFTIFNERNHLENNPFLLWRASQRARHTLEHGDELKGDTTKEKVKGAAVLVIPNLVMYGAILLLVIGIFGLFQVYDGVWWKVFVTGLALAIKIVGNKILIGLLGDLKMYISDGQLYGYEYSTATIVRVLQLSFPDEQTAMLIGLASAVVEVGTRIFFYMLFLKAGLANPRMTADEKIKYAKRGKHRVQDASNDMVVEYMSSIMAGLFMVYLSPTGAFTFVSASSISSNTIIKLCVLQIIPELFLDFYVTFMEIFGGLKEMHVSYWNLSTGADESSKKWSDRIGDVPKATVFKIFITWAYTSLVIIVCLK
ncbi:hypothetical protein TeGR_g11701 [Tetraparma gracilis]|uniref:Uncharacterized protein n=1 Tax=Tetraparma gracilis TaxID=2962635 RepID=A0ABQ6ND67_9STRA|nr:hypothetical protein TeGR_g11701 [Tetraparma gracilis]